jgi:hypothetical protein
MERQTWMIHGSALKHGITAESMIWVVETAGLIFVRPAEPERGRSSEQYVHLGDDPDGTPLEVMSIPTADRRVLIIHAMPLRAKFHDQYLEAMNWRRR